MFSPTIDTRNVGYSGSNERQLDNRHNIGQMPATQEPQRATGRAGNQKIGLRAAKDRRADRGLPWVLHVTRVSLNRGAHGVLGDGP
jgi:hypothetical protein